MLYDPNWKEAITLTPAQQTILDAATVIERYGWCRDRLRAKPGTYKSPHCVIGALYEASGWSGSFNQQEYYDARDLLIQKWGYTREGDLSNWNDHDAKSAEEVVARMRSAVDAV